MKNIITLVVVAVSLFSISAGLSVWLNHPKSQAEGGQGHEHDDGGKKGSAKDAEPKAGKATHKDNERDHRPTDDDHAPRVTEQRNSAAPAVAAALKDKESRLDRRQAQLALIMQDMRAERETYDNLVRQLTAELAKEFARLKEIDEQPKGPAKPPAGAAPKSPAGRKDPDVDPDTEAKNIAKLAKWWETMPPEEAARLSQQMADNGDMQTVVRALTAMKDRNAAKILAAYTDPALAVQLSKKMLAMKPSAPSDGATKAP